MNPNDPKPMDPERLADLRSRIACGRRPQLWFADLLADRDYQVRRVEEAERERDEARAEIEVLIGAARKATGASADEEPEDVALHLLALCEELDNAEAEAGDRWVDEQRVKDVEAELDQSRAEVARLRARVRVEADDIERDGVTRAHVESWLAKQSRWNTDGSTWKHAAWPGHVRLRERIDAWCINAIADFSQRPPLDILNEMAAMPLEPEAKA